MRIIIPRPPPRLYNSVRGAVRDAGYITAGIAIQALGLVRGFFHRPRHAAKSRLARVRLSFFDAETLDWLLALKTPVAETLVSPTEKLIADYMAGMAMIAGRGPVGLRCALIAACDLTDRLGAAVYTAKARQPNPWAQAGAR